MSWIPDLKATQKLQITQPTVNNINNTMQYLQWNCIIPDHFCHHLFVYILLLDSPEWGGERKKSSGRFLYKHELKTNLCYLHYAHLQTPNKFQSNHSLKPLLAQESFPLQQGTSSTVILNYCPNKHKRMCYLQFHPCIYILLVPFISSEFVKRHDIYHVKPHSNHNTMTGSNQVRKT